MSTVTPAASAARPDVETRLARQGREAAERVYRTEVATPDAEVALVRAHTACERVESGPAPEAFKRGFAEAMEGLLTRG